MSTLSELQSLIKSAIQDSSYTDSTLAAFINRCYREVAGDVPLPGLETSGSVTTDTSNPYVALSTLTDGFPDRRYNLQRVYSAALDDLVAIYSSFENFIDNYDPNLDWEGTVEAVCVRGGNLYYQGIPSTADTLTLYYYKTPTALSGSSDSPGGIPEHMHEDIFVNFVAREIFAEQGLIELWELRNRNYQNALARLQRNVGPQPRGPRRIQDRGSYIR